MATGNPFYSPRAVQKPWWRHQMETFSALLTLSVGIHRSPVNSPHKSQWRGALMFSFICPWINIWVNSRKTGDLRRHRGHHDVTVMTVKEPNSSEMISWKLAPNDIASYFDNLASKPLFARRVHEYNRYTTFIVLNFYIYLFHCPWLKGVEAYSNQRTHYAI